MTLFRICLKVTVKQKLDFVVADVVNKASIVKCQAQIEIT